MITRFVMTDEPLVIAPGQLAFAVAWTISAEMVFPSTETLTVPTLAVDAVEPVEPDVETFDAPTVTTPARFVPALESDIVPPADGNGPVSATATTVGVMTGAVMLTLAAVACP